MEKMAHGFQRKGRAAGSGFYDYYDDEDEDPDLWSGLSAFLRRSVKLPADDVRDRLRYIVWVELLNSLKARARQRRPTWQHAVLICGLTRPLPRWPRCGRWMRMKWSAVLPSWPSAMASALRCPPTGASC